VVNDRYYTVIEEFGKCPKETTIVPFWFWNGELRKEELRKQLLEMKSQGVMEAIIHARRGLEIEYLSKEWFDRVKYTLDEANQLGLKIWIYDEYNWPSGYAGGKVLKIDSDYRGKCLQMVKLNPGETKKISIEGKLIGAVKAKVEKGKPVAGSLSDITSDIRSSEVITDADSTIYLFIQKYISWQPAYSDEYYVDLLDPAAVRCFIKTTYEEYANRFPEYLGNTLKGFFTDEPGFYNNFRAPNIKDPNTITWTSQFAAEFHKQKGYSIIPYLPGLWEEIEGVSRKVRIDYFDLLSRMFEEYFFKQIHNWCQDHRLLLTGHVNDEEHLVYRIRGNAQYFRAMKYLHIPGIDKITRETEKITEKLGSSAAHLYDRNVCMSETYGGSGWNLTLQEMKAVADWQYVRGINMMIPHAFYYSIEGDRMWECPPSQFMQNPYWKYYITYSNYMRRLGYMLRRGHHVAHVAFYYPVVSGWKGISPDSDREVNEIDAAFKNLSHELLDSQIDFDYVDDDALTERAIVEDGCIKVFNETYRVLVVPKVSVVALEILKVIKSFVESGGLLVCLEHPQEIMGLDPSQDEEVKILVEYLFGKGQGGAQYDGEKCVKQGRTFVAASDIKQVCEYIEESGNRDITVYAEEDVKPNIKYLHRKDEHFDIYFLINECKAECSAKVSFSAEGLPQLWDAETGEIFQKAHAKSENGMTSISLWFSAYGSNIIVFDKIISGEDYKNLPHLSAAYPKGEIKVQLDEEFHIRVDERKYLSRLVSLTELGHKYFSGTAEYENDFHINDIENGRRLFLDLGEVRETAEVELNGKTVGYKVWAPYLFNITDYVVEGENKLRITLTNTLTNAFDLKAEPYGLFGPIRIMY
jgi:hypothetical protein